MKEQKCSQCKQWNKNAVRCVYCDAPLVASEINKEFKAKIDKEFDERKPSKFFIFAEKLKNSPNIFAKGTYYFFFSLWSIYMFIVSIFVFLIAGTPG